MTHIMYILLSVLRVSEEMFTMI